MIKILLSTRLGERRWTQADLARMTGIRPSTINDLYHGCAEMCSSAIALCMLPVNCYSSSSSPSSLPPVNSSFASSGSSSSSIFGSAICVTSFMGLHRWRLFRVPVSSCVPRPRSTSPCTGIRKIEFYSAGTGTGTGERGGAVSHGHGRTAVDGNCQRAERNRGGITAAAGRDALTGRRGCGAVLRCRDGIGTGIANGQRAGTARAACPSL